MRASKGGGRLKGGQVQFEGEQGMNGSVALGGAGRGEQSLRLACGCIGREQLKNKALSERAIKTKQTLQKSSFEAYGNKFKMRSVNVMHSPSWVSTQSRQKLSFFQTESPEGKGAEEYMKGRF